MKIPITILALALSISLIAQNPIDVTEQTLKIGGTKEEIMYFGFAEGDKIIFDYAEADGKELKEVEIIEYPATSKFSDYKTAKIENKIINVNKKAVYKFRFYNGALGGRVCKIKIQRIPANEQTKNFNSNVTWITKQDTAWNTYTKDIIVGYDTSYVNEKNKVVIKDELFREEIVSNSVIPVHSKNYNWTITGENYAKFNKEITSFDLPIEVKEDLKIIENVSWTYGIGVDQELQLQAAQKNKNILNAGASISTLLGQPELAIVFKVAGALNSGNSSQSAYYAIFPDYDNAKLFKNSQQYYIVKENNIISSGSVRMEKPLTGKVYFGFRNPNEGKMGSGSIKIYFSVSVWRRLREYKYVDERKQLVNPKYEKKIFKDPVITTTKVPVTGQ